LRSLQVAVKRIKNNPNLKTLFIHKSGKLDRDPEYLNQLAEVYYRGLLEVDSFITAHMEYEEQMSKV